MGQPNTDVIQGTLDMLILKTLSLEPMHGFGIARRIEQISRGVFKVNPGSLLTALQRLERAMRQHGLEPTEAVGQPFDPERMEVLEAVTDSGRPPGEVLEEVRRGYLWNGRVFRYAQVRVARS